MTAGVTIQASPTQTVGVMLPSTAMIDAAQQAISAVNAASYLGFVDTEYVPAGASSFTESAPRYIGAVVDSVSGGVNLGTLNSQNFVLVNNGDGTVTATGGLYTTVVSGESGSVIYTNTATSSRPGEVYLGGGNNWVGNAANGDAMTISVGATSLFAQSTVVDASHGSSTVNLYNDALILVQGTSSSTGQVSVNAQPGNVGVVVGGSSTVPVTITGGANTMIYYTADGSSGTGAFINPGAGAVAVMPGMTGSATLFGGTQSWGTAAAFTGAATVFGGNGYYEGGSAGYNVLQTSTVNGAATLIGGGSHDFMDVQASGDFIHVGNGQGVIAYTEASVTGGDTFGFGSGSGTVLGGEKGHNNFVFAQNGAYTVAGFHDLTNVVNGDGSVYQEVAGGGNNNIFIVDFVPQFSNQNGTLTFDKFLLNSGVTATIDNASGHSVATLSDGTTVTFNNAIVTNHGSFLA